MDEIIQNPFDIQVSNQIVELIERVKETRDELDGRRPFSKKAEERILKELTPIRVVDSLNTEGIMVTRRQTLNVMQALHAHEVVNKSELEIKNMLEADEFVLDATEDRAPLAPGFIRDLGSMVTNGLVNEAKNYRVEQVTISGAEFQPPNASDVPLLVQDLCDEYNRTSDLDGPIRAAWLHATFTRIHPFSDGNGRTGRLLQNWSLINNGYFPIGMPLSRRDDYYDALESADSGDWNDLIELVCLLELDVLGKIKAIVKELDRHSVFIKTLSKRANESKKNTLYASYYAWRTSFDDLAKAFLNTTQDLNAESDLIHVKYRGYDISSFKDWNEMREEGWMPQSWLFSLLYSVDRNPFYRTIAFFREHRRQTCDPIDFPECISLYFTGTEHKSDGTEEKPSYTYYEDECISLREIVIYEGKYYVYTQPSPDSDALQVKEYDSIYPVIEELLSDVFIKKAGI